MDALLKIDPLLFFLCKVGSVTVCILFLNKAVGHSGRQLYLFLAAFYWAVLIWHTFGALTICRSLPT